MFYKANPLLFARAKELRNNVTQAEMVLWGYLRTKPLGYKFRRQHPIGIYIADFFCYKLKLIIEVDGAVHTKEEIKVLRFTNDEVMKQPETVIEKTQIRLHE